MTKAAEGRPVRPAAEIATLMESLEFEVLNAPVGDFVAPDSKLQFTIKEGDVLVKAAQPKGGDFILLQLREEEGAWRVVAEYLD
jgi:hypothetical protein